jgi:type III restriction enzyme
MKFTLKDYQENAVSDVLVNLNKAKKRWHEDSDHHAFSLTATTGAGKTVMAAAVFEALFYGDDDNNFESDPTATVIWFSDAPSLNEQTRFRLLEASDKLNYNDLVVVESSFSEEKFEKGKIYFLNTQKLGKKSLLVRGYDPDGASDDKQSDLFPDTRPDLRSHTIWEVLKNTIEDLNTTLYLVLDEAHRGMGDSTNAEKSTIVKRLINGAGSVPAIPVVWGISATVDRFSDAMKVAKNRALLPNIEVDAKLVQDSGLLKDDIVLDIPEETGKFDHVLLRRGVDKLKESTKAWQSYCESQGIKPVVPLMVLQVPNKPNNKELGEAIDVLLEHWSELRVSNISHVFGQGTNLIFGSHTIYYAQPEKVQDLSNIRILLAKDAISTGWDCPRAEVMVSFRPARETTYITQLLGRMVRTPLARRIPGNELLNAVYCLLPFYDKKNVTEIAKKLMYGGGSEAESKLTGRRVLINPVELKPNETVADDVWDKLISLPSQLLPKRISKPIKRLTLLAHELAQDGFKLNAGKLAHAEMHKVLDKSQELFSEDIILARNDIKAVEGVTLRASMSNKDMTFDKFVEEADVSAIQSAYKRAARIISPDISRTYSDYLADNNVDSYSREDALFEAHVDVAALGLVSQVADFLNKEAECLTNSWLEEHQEKIKTLNDERREVYLQIKEMSKDPQDTELLKPRSWIHPTTVLDADGSQTPLPKFSNHLMSDTELCFSSEFNKWEAKVLETEMANDGFEAWYRNPERASAESLAIAYEEAGEYSLLRPDFIFFARDDSGDIVADIVDPHGIHLADAIWKLKGLADYAEKYDVEYGRIESIADPENDGKFRLLDLKNLEVREAIRESYNAKLLFKSDIANDYKTTK